jgi:hypothetical protein
VTEMRYYIDCEFDGHNGPLLSMAIVCDEFVNIHINVINRATDPWVMANVIPVMEMHKATKSVLVHDTAVGQIIRDFLDVEDHPVIVADSPVDIGRFCRSISTNGDGSWASVDFSRMTFEVHNIDCYPTSLDGAVQHNAWWDAMALKHALTKVAS